MFEPAVDGLGRSVAGAGSVKVGQYVVGALLQRSAQGHELPEPGRDAVADRLDELDHQLPSGLAVGVSVGGDHPLVDPPGRFDRDMVVGGEEVAQPLGLLVGEEVGAGVQGPSRGVERVVLVAAVAVDDLLDPAPAPVQGVAGQA